MPVYGQSPVLKNYNTKQGLPSSEVYSIIQDSKGYIWTATDRGVAKFDGYSFKSFTTAQGLPDNTVFELYEDCKKRIWFSTFSTQLGYFENDCVHLYRYNALIKKLIPSEIICKFYVDGNDNLWFETSFYNTFKINKITAQGQVSFPTPFHKTDQKNILVSRDNTCLAFGGFKAETTAYISLETNKKMFDLPVIRQDQVGIFRYYKHDDKAWAFSDNCLYYIDKNNCSKVIKGTSEVLSAFVDSNRIAWMCYRAGGAVGYGQDGNIKFRVLDKYSVSCICQDWQGGMWFGTLEKGIYYMPPRAPLSFTEESGLPVSIVKKIKLIQGNITLLLANDRYIILSRQPPYKLLYNPGKNGARMRMRDINESRGHGIYYCGLTPISLPYTGNIYYINTETVIAKPEGLWGISSNNIDLYDFKGRPIRHTSLDQISRIRFAFSLNDKHILICTLNGLYDWDGFNINDLTNTNEAWKHRISSICRINQNYLVLATIGYGIYIVRENDFAHPVQLTDKDGLPGIMCHSLYAENDTVLWVGTNKGISRISHILEPVKRRFKTIDINNGLTSNEVNDITSIDGQIWVATMNGVCILSSNQQNTGYWVPVYIEQITANSHAVDIRREARLAYKENQLSFFFTAIDYQYSAQLQYAYKLLPTDTGWNYTGNRNVIYNTLPPGQYTFMVSAIPPGSVKPGNAIAYSFTIASPYWKTWWFIALLSLLGLTGINFFIRYRVSVAKGKEKLKNELYHSKETALRAQMKPHFVYNTLNTIQNYILKNEMSSSVSLLSKFSRLMRLTFSNTDRSLVKLSDDLQALQLYTDLENLRFIQKFTFNITVDGSIDLHTVLIPPLIIQPFVENAIVHGLLNKDGPGVVHLTISKEKECFFIQVKDNGIGRAQSALIKQNKQKYTETYPEEQSKSGLSVTRARIEQAWGGKWRNDKPGAKSIFTIRDIFNNEHICCGTAVEFYLPANL